MEIVTLNLVIKSKKTFNIAPNTSAKRERIKETTIFAI
jgi:hypothetical protein